MWWHTVTAAACTFAHLLLQPEWQQVGQSCDGQIFYASYWTAGPSGLGSKPGSDKIQPQWVWAQGNQSGNSARSDPNTSITVAFGWPRLNNNAKNSSRIQGVWILLEFSFVLLVFGGRTGSKVGRIPQRNQSRDSPVTFRDTLLYRIYLLFLRNNKKYTFN